jgi:hypothetical protein
LADFANESYFVSSTQTVLTHPGTIWALALPRMSEERRLLWVRPSLWYSRKNNCANLVVAAGLSFKLGERRLTSDR